MESFLIVGLGNPGKTYEKTRHNVGFMAVDALANKYQAKFKKENALKGELAMVKIENDTVYLFKPTTYMNESGQAVIACKNYFQIDLERLLIIADDADIPFGEVRMRMQSSSGGHNGLQSIEDHLHTKAYCRLRIGVGRDLQADLASYVLGRFNEKERESLSAIIDTAVEGMEIWQREGAQKAMNQLNRKNKNEEKNND